MWPSDRPAADGRDAVALDPGHRTRLGWRSMISKQWSVPRLSCYSSSSADRLAVGVDRDDRRVLAAHADRDDVGRGSAGAAAVTSRMASTTAAQSARGSCSAVSPAAAHRDRPAGPADQRAVVGDERDLGVGRADVDAERVGHGGPTGAGKLPRLRVVDWPATEQVITGVAVMSDLVIRGARVVDGTGAPERTADVAVDDGRITEVGRVDGRGDRELDGDGLVLAPGWVDIHTHYDGQVTWDPEVTPSSWHGVTTVVMGNCGVGLRAGPAGRARLPHRADGGRRGHPRHRPARGHRLAVGELRRVPRRARRARPGCSTSPPRCPTPRCGPT